MKRPANHVTRALDDLRAEELARPIPEVPEDLLTYLEALYLARCYDHTSESLEDHLVHAGKVSLVQDLRAAYENRLKASDPDDDDPFQEKD